MDAIINIAYHIFGTCGEPHPNIFVGGIFGVHKKKRKINEKTI